MTRLSMPEHDAKLIEIAEIYDRAAAEQWQNAENASELMAKHEFELAAKKFEWEAEQIRIQL